jgi:hypothetical protein
MAQLKYWNGTAWVDAVIGAQGTQGPQGVQGLQGPQGTQGLQGIQGVQGTQGIQGIQSMQGTTGIQGIQGVTGASGVSSSYFEYKIDANSTTNTQPANGDIRYSNATQINSTALYINHLTSKNIDIDMFLALLKVNDNVFIQDANDSNNYQKFKVSGTINPGNNTYVQIPVTYVEGLGLGTTGFPNNHSVILVTTAVGIQGTTGTQGLLGLQGTQGVQGTTGIQGLLGLQGSSGYVGLDGAQGTQGTQGLQGTQGVQGIQGAQGVQGSQGTQGLQGVGTFYTYSSNPPSSPAVGDRWVDSDDGVSYTYTYDGDSYAWVELNAIGYAGLQGIPGPQGITGIGAQGLQGSLGIQGINGIQGPTGSAVYDLDQAVISMQVFR